MGLIRGNQVFFRWNAMVLSSVRVRVAIDRDLMKPKYAILFAFCLITITVCPPMRLFGQKKVPPRAVPNQRSQLFSSYCASCHGLDGRGGQRAPDIAGHTKLSQASDVEIEKIVREGVPGTGMPAFRSLGAIKIQALVQHLRTLQGLQSQSPLPGSPDAGKVLFFGKAACSECHLANGAGG